MGPHDPEIAALLAHVLGLLEKGIQNALIKARKKGELAAGKNPRLLAKAITNALIGMAVTGKLKVNADSIGDIYKGTLCMLD